MPAVARDDEIGAGGHGCRDDLIVIGISSHYAGYFGGFHQLDGLDVIGQHLAGCLADQSQPPGRRGTGEHVDQFFKQRRAAAELYTGLQADGGQQMVGVPCQSRADNTMLVSRTIRTRILRGGMAGQACAALAAGGLHLGLDLVFTGGLGTGGS